MTAVATLTGAHLDYWVARASGVPGAQLRIQPVQRPDPRTPECYCVVLPPTTGFVFGAGSCDPSTNWATGGPLIEKHEVDLIRGFGGVWLASSLRRDIGEAQNGPTPLIAICRFVVRAAFGDTVSDEVAP